MFQFPAEVVVLCITGMELTIANSNISTLLHFDAIKSIDQNY